MTEKHFNLKKMSGAITRVVYNMGSPGQFFILTTTCTFLRTLFYWLLYV